MRTLAHYTVWNAKVYHLHTFELSADKVSHYKAEGETADTKFVEGILIITQPLSEEKLAEINALLSVVSPSSLKEKAEAIAAIAPSTSAEVSIYAFIPHIAEKIMKL